MWSCGRWSYRFRGHGESQTIRDVSRVCAGYHSLIVRSWFECSGSCVVFGCLLVAVANECDAPIDTRNHVGFLHMLQWNRKERKFSRKQR